MLHSSNHDAPEPAAVEPAAVEPSGSQDNAASCQLSDDEVLLLLSEMVRGVGTADCLSHPFRASDMGKHG